MHCISPSPKCAHVQLQSSYTTLSDRNSNVDAKQARSVDSSRDGVSQGDFCKFSSYFEGYISSVLYQMTKGKTYFSVKQMIL